MKTFQTTNGKAVQVSDQDYAKVIQHKWTADKNGYVYSWVGKTCIRLHRWILGAQRGQVIDHADRNPLNNRRSNIRFASCGDNRANSKKMLRKGKALSRYKGVTKIRRRRKNPWQAGIAHNKRWIFLGTYPTPKAAAKAYDAAALRYYGPFALTNKMLYGI